MASTNNSSFNIPDEVSIVEVKPATSVKPVAPIKQVAPIEQVENVKKVKPLHAQMKKLSVGPPNAKPNAEPKVNYREVPNNKFAKQKSSYHHRDATGGYQDNLNNQYTPSGNKGSQHQHMPLSPRTGSNYLVYIYIPNAHDSNDPDIRKSIGFKNDALVLKSSLEYKTKNIRVEFIYSDVKQSFDRAMAGKVKADVGIFINQVSDYKLFAYSERNWLLCNHEVFMHVVDESQLNKMRKIDVVLCKTQVGVEWVQQCKDKYKFTYKICKTGFTSPFKADYIPIDKKDAGLIVHTAGQHHWKQTAVVLQCWYKYGGELPRLIVTCFQAVMDEMVEKGWLDKEIYDASIASKIPNLTLYTKPIPYDELKVIKMKAGCHICISMTEGFGHIINEGRICSGIIITTNGAPMNELVDKTCSVLINPYKEGLKRNGTKIYEVHPMHLRDAVKIYMNLPLEHRIILGERAHKKYIEDQSYFYSVMSKIQTFIKQGFEPSYDPFV